MASEDDHRVLVRDPERNSHSRRDPSRPRARSSSDRAPFVHEPDESTGRRTEQQRETVERAPATPPRPRVVHSGRGSSEDGRHRLRLCHHG